MHLTKSSRVNLGTIASVFGAIFAVAVALVIPESRIIAFCAAGGLVVAAVLLTARRYIVRVHVDHTVRDTLDDLRTIVLKAERSVWTARTQLGDPALEQRYFDALLTRVVDTDRPLEEFQRIILLNSSPGTQRHIHWLIDKFADIPSVQVRYYVGVGPPFDFMICDEATAVLGLPKAGSESFASAIFFNRVDVVIGMRDAFKLLWNNSTPLFIGKADITSSERAALKSQIDAAIEDL
jgi:hypothetical protein